MYKTVVLRQKFVLYLKPVSVSVSLLVFVRLVQILRIYRVGLYLPGFVIGPRFALALQAGFTYTLWRCLALPGE